MNSDVGNSSQQSQNSQRSQRSLKSQDSFDMSDIDDLLDFDKPPIFNSPKYSVRPGKYATKLKISRSSQMTTSSDNSSNLDSGFDSLQSSSFFRMQPNFPSKSSGNDESFTSQPLESIDIAASNANEESGLLIGSPFQTDEQHFHDQDAFSADSDCEGASGISSRKRFCSQIDTAPASSRQLDLFSATSTLSSFDSFAPKDQCDKQMDETQNTEELSPNIVVSSTKDAENQSLAEAQPPIITPEEPLSGIGLTEIDPILKLFSQVKSQNTDCAFVSALAANMCKDIYPKDSNISLKTALLLSIVSCNSQSGASPISIMAISRDSATVSSIMGLIGNFASRFICISDDLKFNGKCAQTKTIEANSLLMARNGVCFIGDWMGLKPASLNYLRNVIDSGRVTCDASSNIEYALMCAIWMYWTCSAKKMKQNQQHLSMISMLFGIPVVLDESPSQQVIDFIFDKYTTKPVQNEQTAPNDAEVDGINDDAIKAFLKFVSNISTEFDGEALALLKYYFIVTRSVRPNILTPKSFDVLQRLSECHAQLCLRRDVLKIDVIFSIELFEQFVLNVYAGEVPTKPMPNTSSHTLQQVDENMYAFAEWLEGYLSKFNENVNSFFRE